MYNFCLDQSVIELFKGPDNILLANTSAVQMQEL